MTSMSTPIISGSRGGGGAEDDLEEEEEEEEEGRGEDWDILESHSMIC
jgi:hypothetical protein